jgi:hypothetical protein
MDRCREESPPLEVVYEDAEHESSCWLSHQKAERDAIRTEVVGEVVAS